MLSDSAQRKLVTHWPNAWFCILSSTRGVQKVRRLTQLTTTYAHHILSLFNIVSCNWNCAWSSISPKLWYHCRRIVVPGLSASHLLCNTNTNGEYGRWRSSSKPEFWMAASALADLWSDALFWLQATSVFLKLKEFMIRHKISWRRGRYLHGMWMAGRPRTTILLQRDQSFGEMLDQVHFSCGCLCWKVIKYDGRAYLVINCVGLRTFWTPLVNWTDYQMIICFYHLCMLHSCVVAEYVIHLLIITASSSLSSVVL